MKVNQPEATQLNLFEVFRQSNSFVSHFELRSYRERDSSKCNGLSFLVSLSDILFRFSASHWRLQCFHPPFRVPSSDTCSWVHCFSSIQETLMSHDCDLDIGSRFAEGWVLVWIKYLLTCFIRSSFYQNHCWTVFASIFFVLWLVSQFTLWQCPLVMNYFWALTCQILSTFVLAYLMCSLDQDWLSFTRKAWVFTFCMISDLTFPFYDDLSEQSFDQHQPWILGVRGPFFWNVGSVYFWRFRWVFNHEVFFSYFRDLMTFFLVFNYVVKVIIVKYLSFLILAYQNLTCTFWRPLDCENWLNELITNDELTNWLYANSFLRVCFRDYDLFKILAWCFWVTGWLTFWVWVAIF